MNKLYLILFLCFLYLPDISAQEKTYCITGKVFGNEQGTIAPLINAYIQIREKTNTGFSTDSLGCFQIEHLTKGKYHLHISFIGFESYDTVIRIRNNSINRLNIILPLYYDKKEVSVKKARKEIKKGHPHLYARTEDEKNAAFRQFYTRYKVSFTIYNPRLIHDKIQHLGIPDEALIRYNQETFRYLDKTFGKSWRQHIPPGIIGIKEVHRYRHTL